VKNWTHRNSFGRVVIGVNVACNSDPRRTRDILLAVAKDNPDVMTTPEPSVDFEEFGADSLNFKLYACTYNLARNMSVRTDLRIAILEAFQQAGIRMAFLQTDVTVRTIEKLREAVSNYVSGPANGRGDGLQASRRMRETGG
jgi:small-conductance mechanosensitive channel